MIGGFPLAQLQRLHPPLERCLVGFLKLDIGRAQLIRGLLDFGDIALDGEDTGLLIDLDHPGGHQANRNLAIPAPEGSLQVDCPLGGQP
jgi:hypothetical protein